MKILIQRVKSAAVKINDELYSNINKVILVFFCVEKNDKEESIEWLANKLLKLRIFEDENGKMNRSVVDENGEILVVSQFTLAGNCQKGTRPSFDKAASPQHAELFYNKFIERLCREKISVKTGVFRAMMDISLVNWGPVTFMLEHEST